jgi:hypothetical protein
MAEAANPDPASYASFNEFFTRAAAPGARPLADAPTDLPGGRRHQPVRPDRPATRSSRPRATTTAPPRWWAATRRWPRTISRTATSPPVPEPARLPPHPHALRRPAARMIHVPGALFSVNPTTARGVPGLFARNERVVCVFDTARGPFVLVLVGATIVGSMATTWHGVVNPPRLAACASGATTTRTSPEAGRRDGPLPAGLHRGAAVPARAPALQPGLGAGRARIRMGEPAFGWPALGLVRGRGGAARRAVAYSAYSFLQRELGAARTALMLYLAPVYAPSAPGWCWARCRRLVPRGRRRADPAQHLAGTRR